MSTENDYTKFNELIKKIEFHEFKSSGYSIAGIETQVYATEGKFIELCEWLSKDYWTESKIEKQSFELNLKDKLKSKAKDPKFQISVGERFNSTSIVVHPKQNMVSVAICGIHYICQHSFDMFPCDIRVSLMSYIGRYDKLIEIGLLYLRPRHGKVHEPIKVYNKDIYIGFMQPRETNLTYRDDFGTFIIAQRAKETET
jgi:sulfatase maturation enzyme AslB (radical SAM superfamily)